MVLTTIQAMERAPQRSRRSFGALSLSCRSGSNPRCFSFSCWRQPNQSPVFLRQPLSYCREPRHLARKYPGRLLIEGDSTIGSLLLQPRCIIISLEVASIKQWRGAILKTTRAATSPGGPLLRLGPLVLAQLVTTRRTVSVRQTLAGT